MRGADLFFRIFLPVIFVIQCGFLFFSNEKKNRHGDKFSGGTFFLKLQTSFFLLNRHHRTTANAQTPTLTQPTTQRRQHILTRPNKHITHFHDRYMPTSLQVARGLHSYAGTVVSCMIRTCSAKQGIRQRKGTLTLWQVRAVCTQRESDWTSDHCHGC